MKLVHAVSTKLVVAALAVLMLATVFTASASASPIVLAQKTLADLFLTPTDTPAEAILAPPTTMLGLQPVLSADVYSACYQNSDGMYVYLYQVNNTGAPDYHEVEMLTISQFFGATTSTDMGYLTPGTDLPTGFLTGAGQAPESSGNVKSGVLSFYYREANNSEIDVGEHSDVMYVVSPWGPTTVTGNIIDGTVATGPVVGPVPEPATMAILAIGGGIVLLRTRRRK